MTCRRLVLRAAEAGLGLTATVALPLTVSSPLGYAACAGPCIAAAAVCGYIDARTRHRP